jgi:single-strand DNA-binding protein
MPSYNRVILAGHLTRDPALKRPTDTLVICEFGIAINHKWRDRNDQDQEEVCFVDCAIFGKQAETFNQYMTKGRPVLVEGRLKLNQWETEGGQKRSKLSVVVDRFVFLGDGGERQGSEARESATEPPVRPPPPPPTDDDIPF